MKNKNSFLLFNALFTTLILLSGKCFSQLNPNFAIGTATGKYAFNAITTPDALIEMNQPSFTSPPVTLEHTWEASDRPLDGFETISSTEDQNETAGSHDYHFPDGYHLPNTKYYREKIKQINTGQIIYSNTIRLQLVSINWEDRNYIRVHEVLTQGITDWQKVDNLPIGDKLQTTTFLDGTGRVAEKVSRETATPQREGDKWGDIVQFNINNYDVYGREVKQYLPYTSYNTGNNNQELGGRYKSDPASWQGEYYAGNYNEGSPYSNITYENSPLSRAQKVNAPGTSWATSKGNSSLYEMNDENDHVKIFSIGYKSGDEPMVTGEYEPGTLYRTTSIDENGKSFIQYTNIEGQLILTKEQTEPPRDPYELNNPYIGWICVYSIYDDFGLLRYRLQPEAVSYLSMRDWSFEGGDGKRVLDELCFRYEYDEKGRTILKKAPGAAPLQMLYDKRDRVVYMQDGNQAKKQPAEWTVNLYDDLDRLVMTTLYKTPETTTELQANIDRADMERSQAIRVNEEQKGTIAVTLLGSPLSENDLNDAHRCTVVKYLFYDNNYAFPGVQRFDTRSNNIQAYQPGNDKNVLGLESSNRTLSFPTGSLVRVLGTSTLLASTEYYDEQGNHIQTTEENIKGGSDVTTLQYHWDGRVLSTDTKHIATERNGLTSLDVITKNVFDRIGRLTSLQKKYGDNEFKTIATYDFDDMGRLKTKHLDPGYAGSGGREMESLTYSYNIHNNITGINKDYALKTEGSYDKWGHFFGLYLGYDNKDRVFTNAQLDGHVSGQLWTTQGDDAQRKYDYTYDYAGRLKFAGFTEKNLTDPYWSNSKMDFSTGKISYDLNGNLKTMVQWGIRPGSNTPVLIDNLQYLYADYSNKLVKVNELTDQVDINGLQGDFKGSREGTDYEYDDNGNIITDRNKEATKLEGEETGQGISYNFLDKPERIHIAGKGTIQFVYDADGNKLQKIFTPESGERIPVTTTYINQFVYKDDDLQYINFEEGRIRIIQPVSASNDYGSLYVLGGMSMSPGTSEKMGVYDFFIRDYQQNVRMIVTEEEHRGSNKCSMETDRAGDEEPVFGQVDANGQPTDNNEVKKTRFAVADIPGQSASEGWQNAQIQSSVSRVGALAASKTGPNVLLKVMAGDILNATTQYYYQNAVTNTPGNNLTMPVLSSLINAIAESPATNALVKGSMGGIQEQLQDNQAFTAITAPDAGDATTQYPKAYLSVLFFDERFNFVGESSATYRVTEAGSNNASLTFSTPAKAPKNGYAYVYVSNESDEPVYFDNFNVSDSRGRLIEEDHYYPFGLKIGSISSQKLGDPNEGMLDNKNLFNDKELTDDADLDWYDYGFRSYDAQIGRFTQLDPLTDDYPELTPFQYAGDEPVANIDIDGLEAGTAIEGAKTVIDGGALQEVIVRTAQKVAEKAPGLLNKAGNFLSKEVMPRLGGVLKAGAGWALMTAGAPLIEIGVGIPIVLAGADYAASGTSQIIDGKHHQTLMERSLTDGLDMKPEDAKDVVNLGFYIATPMVASESVAGNTTLEQSEEMRVFQKSAPKKYTVSPEVEEEANTVKTTQCFVQGTLIWTVDSVKSIEEIKVGDSVYSYSVTEEKAVKSKVIKTYVHTVHKLLLIQTAGDSIYTTLEHPFYIHKEWTSAKDIHLGDSLFSTVERKTTTVINVRVIDTTATVYNFNVEREHDYFVGNDKILVHNQCDPGGQKAQDVIDYASKNNGATRNGYKGNKFYSNDGRDGTQILPRQDAQGNAISYREYDVNPYKKGVNRGTERVVIGSDGTAWYTGDHYIHFNQLTP